MQIPLGIHVDQLEKLLGHPVAISRTAVLDYEDKNINPSLLEAFPRYYYSEKPDKHCEITFYFNPDKKLIEISRLEKRLLYSETPF